MTIYRSVCVHIHIHICVYIYMMLYLCVYADVSCILFQEVNKYCLKPAHGLYGQNNCL